MSPRFLDRQQHAIRVHVSQPHSPPGVCGCVYGRHGGRQAAGLIVIVHGTTVLSKQISQQQPPGGAVGSVTQQTLHVAGGQLHGGIGGGGRTGYQIPAALWTSMICAIPGVGTGMHAPGGTVVTGNRPRGIVHRLSMIVQFVRLQIRVLGHAPHGTPWACTMSEAAMRVNAASANAARDEWVRLIIVISPRDLNDY